MAPGSVIVDIAERGGNCELTRPGETVQHGNVTILGPTNLPADVPFHASQMFAKNITTLLTHLVDDGKIRVGHDRRNHAGNAGRPRWPGGAPARACGARAGRAGRSGGQCQPMNCKMP